MKKRFLAIMLTLCMLLSIMPTAAFAKEEQQPIITSEACTHHTHGDQCGYKAAVSEVPCDKNCTDTDGDGIIDHTDCAYCEAVPESPCTFDEAACEICHPKDGNTGLTEPDAGLTEPDTGLTEPDTGLTKPDTGLTKPDTGLTEPDTGLTEPDTGSPKNTTDVNSEENAAAAPAAATAKIAEEPVEAGDFTVATSETAGYTYDATNNLLKITKKGDYTIGMKKGIDTTSQCIAVTAADEVTLTLNSVNIEAVEGKTALTLNVNTSITLPEGTTSNLTGGDGIPGSNGGNGIIFSGNSLNIKGSGTLNVTGGIGGNAKGYGDGERNGNKGGYGLQCGGTLSIDNTCTLNVTGGDGGNANNAGSSSVISGTGGIGGAAGHGIVMTTHLIINGNATIIGGVGGIGGQGDEATATSGYGGDGINGRDAGGDTKKNLSINGNATIIGGRGGNGNDAAVRKNQVGHGIPGGDAGVGGFGIQIIGIVDVGNNGKAAAENLVASEETEQPAAATAPTVTGGDGGNGGNGGIVAYTNSYIGGKGGNGGRGGNGLFTTNSNNVIAALSAQGGKGGNGGNTPEGRIGSFGMPNLGNLGGAGGPGAPAGKPGADNSSTEAKKVHSSSDVFTSVASTSEGVALVTKPTIGVDGNLDFTVTGSDLHQAIKGASEVLNVLNAAGLGDTPMHALLKQYDLFYMFSVSQCLGFADSSSTHPLAGVDSVDALKGFQLTLANTAVSELAANDLLKGFTVSTAVGSLALDQKISQAFSAAGKDLVAQFSVLEDRDLNTIGNLQVDEDSNVIGTSDTSRNWNEGPLDVSDIVHGHGTDGSVKASTPENHFPSFTVRDKSAKEGANSGTGLFPIVNANSFNVRGAMYGTYTAVTEPISIIGNRPMVRISITGKNGEKIADLGGGHITVGIPYTLQPNEDSSRIIGLTVDEKGNETILTNSTYSEKDKMLYINGTNYSGVYAVGYLSEAPKFNDTANHWAKNDIEFVTARGFLAGTDNNVFSPDTAITKGDFVKSLTEIAGKDMSSLIKGDKNQSMTRQEMAEIMVQFAESTGYKFTKNRVEMKFTDTQNEAVKTMQMAGVIMAKSGNNFDPAGHVTKAEASSVLRRYVELLINISTSQGLDMNDSGQIVYYEKGNLFTGEKTVDGTTYHFDKDGIYTKIDAVVPDTKKYIIHKIVHGDTLWNIARNNKCTVAELAELNGIKDPNNVLVGTEIKIPQR